MNTQARAVSMLGVLLVTACGPEPSTGEGEGGTTTTAGPAAETTTSSALDASSSSEESSTTDAAVQPRRCAEVSWIAFGETDGHTFAGAVGSTASPRLLFENGFDIPTLGAVIVGSDAIEGPWAVAQLIAGDEPRAAADVDGDGAVDAVLGVLDQPTWWRSSASGELSDGGVLDLQQSDALVVIPGDPIVARAQVGTRLEIARGDGAGGFDLTSWHQFPDGYDGLRATSLGVGALWIEITPEDCMGFCGASWIVAIEDSGSIVDVAIVDGRAIALRDVDADGELDWLVLDGDVLRYDGAQPDEPTSLATDAREAGVGDLDADGELDLVASDLDGLFLRFGDAGVFDDPVPVELDRIDPVEIQISPPLDLDGDGADEVIIAEGGGDDVAVLRTALCPP